MFAGNDSKTYPNSYFTIEKDSNKNLNTNKIAVSENSKIFVSSFSDSYSKNIQKPTFDPKSGHHRLCEQNVDKNKKIKNTENVKGPRYCSMVQTGSKNILLDNVDNTYAPVIYTRQSSAEKKHRKTENVEKLHVSESSLTGSVSSDDKNLKSLSLSEDNSLHKQQRVAEWVQNLDENDTNSENSQKRNSIDQLEKNKKDEKIVRKISNNIKLKYKFVSVSIPPK